VETRTPIGPPLTGHTVAVWGLAFSPDGQLLASSDGFGAIRLWEVASGRPIGAALKGHAGWMTGPPAFSLDGKTLYSGCNGGEIRTWDMDPASWRERACRVVGRNMTQAEWAEYMPGVPYHKTCEQWPAGE